jgi:hypothetical protein
MFTFNGHIVPTSVTPTHIDVESMEDVDQWDVSQVFTMVIWEDGEVRTKDCDSAAQVRDTLDFLAGDPQGVQVLHIIEGEHLPHTGERTTYSRR